MVNVKTDLTKEALLHILAVQFKEVFCYQELRQPIPQEQTYPKQNNLLKLLAIKFLQK